MGMTRERLKARKAIAHCGRMCENALIWADLMRRIGNAPAADEWQTRAAWWSEEAFREAAA